MMFLHLLTTMFAGLIANAVLTPLIILLAHRYRWYDERNHRKIHTDDTPRIGGVGIYAGFLIAALVAITFGMGTASIRPFGPHAGAERLIVDFLPLILGMTVIFWLGLIDDFRNLRAAHKLIIQIAAAAIVTIGPFRIDRYTVPFLWQSHSLGVLSVPVTVIWIVSISNALNFIDGVDGLAGGNAALAALFFAVIALMTGQGITALLAVALLGSVLGFLAYNMPSARIFMGDSGSYVLGFLLAVFPLLVTEGEAINLNLIPAITVLGVPVLDVTTSVFRRVKRGQHPFSADREHLHHKLMEIGFGTRQILAVTYAASILFGLVAVSWYLLPANAAFLTAFAIWITASAGVMVLSRARRRQVEQQPE